MEFKYHDYTINIENSFNYNAIFQDLLDYMWEENFTDYEEYMALRRADFEAEDQFQREEYNSSYNISFGMECAREDYERNLEQECSWIVDRWKERFYNNISEEKSPRKRKNALTGRL